MTDNPEVTDEQRRAVREKYNGEQGESNSSLSALGWLSAAAFLLAIIGMIIVATTESMTTLTIWSGLIGAGVTAGFLALVAYLATKAILTSRK